jgi:phenylalanyl-tRNA synthetase beta chain
MLASHNWLMELTGLTLEPSEVAVRLTAAGLEVEGTRTVAGVSGVVVAEVRGLRPHPARENLRLVSLFDGVQEQEVVCGAPNVPAPGGLVAFARLGTTLPSGVRIEERKLGGIVSRGMICSAAELDIGSDADGILIIDAGPRRAPGTALDDALPLRDTLYTISVTPNRPDCLGHVGIARELAALHAVPFAAPNASIARQLAAGSTLVPAGPQRVLLSGAGAAPAVAISNEGVPPGVQVRVIAPERCPRYAAALVLGVTIGATPFELRYRLHTLGLRSISNVVDATNLILLGWGYPIHAFDLEKLRDARIEVRLAQPGETMQTLDGITRTLTEDDLLICDGAGPVALAGVMGGANSEISPTTRHVLIECAYFDPRSVRRTSKRTGLHTDSSHRFERGVDPQAVRAVLTHAASMIAALSGGAALPEAFDVQGTLPAQRRATFDAARASALLGTPVDIAQARDIFKRLGCVVQTQVDTSVLDVVLPSFRPDLSREVDLIEEYARIRGYDSIPTLLPRIRPSSEGSAPEIAFVRKLRESCVAVGLSEAVNFALVAPGDLPRARVPLEAPCVANPMSEERSVLRTALLPGLLHNLQLAQRHQQKRFSAFEVARVFRDVAPGELPHEHYELGVLLWGLRQNWYDEREQLDFFDAKGVLESVTQLLIGRAVETLPDALLERDAAFLHPRRVARVVLAGAPVGVVGEVHPDVVEAFDLVGQALYAVVDVAALLRAAQGLPARSVSALPRLPSSTRDLAVVVEEALPAGDVASVLRSAAPELTESVRLFDIYRGAPVPEGHKSLAFHVVYRDPATTLTDKRVDDIHARVSAAAEKHFAAALRR